MLPLALLLAIQVTGHYPTQDMLDSCTVSQAPNTDMAVMLVYQQRRYLPQRVYLSRDCHGLQGQAFAFSVPPDTEAVYWCEVLDAAGNVLHHGACQGPNVVQVAFTTAVPPTAPGAQPVVRWFDILGRRIPEPRASGVYWKEESGRTRRLVFRK